jgi:prophage tail gpP-like protein
MAENAMSGNGVTLVAGGTQFGPWERVDISRQMEALAGKFELGISDAAPLAPSLPKFAPQTPCQVQIGGANVISGFIDSAGPELTADGHIITVKGRDATGDLVDCSYEGPPRQFFGPMTYQQIVTALLKGFPIRLTVDPSAASAASLPINAEAAQPTETVANTLDRISREAGALTVPDGNGGLVITRAGSGAANTRLAVGDNCERVSFTRDDSGRFSKYVILDQGVTDFQSESDLASPLKAIVYDTGIKRYRPKLIVAEAATQASQQLLNLRALWEAAVRYGRAFRGVYSVPSWNDASGALWNLNAMVQVVDPVAQVNEELLICGVQFQLDNGGGTHALITVVRREAFLTAPIAGLPAFDAVAAGASLGPLPGNIQLDAQSAADAQPEAPGP